MQFHKNEKEVSFTELNVVIVLRYSFIDFCFAIFLCFHK